MYFYYNNSRDYIIKIKRNLNVVVSNKTNTFKLEMNNDYIYLKKLFKQYKIKIKDLINFKVGNIELSREFLLIAPMMSNGKSFTREMINKEVIRIEYIKNDKVYFLEYEYGDDIKSKLEGLSNYFITKRELCNNKELEYDKSFIEINRDYSNEEIEKIIENSVQSSGKELLGKGPISTLLGIFLIIIGMIAITLFIGLSGI